MPFSLRKNSNDASVGLDIDGRFLAAAQVKDGRLVRAISAELPEGVIKDGEVADSERLVGALKDFASAANLPKGVHLGVANQQIVVRVVELPRIEGEAEREAAVRFQAAEAIAMPLDDTVLDYQVAGYAEGPDGTPRMQVVLVAARRKMIEQLTAAVKEAGLKAEGIDLDAFALVRTLVPEEDAATEDSSRVYVHLGGITNLAVAVGNVCFFARPLSAVWTEPDASSLLADEIRLSIDYYMAQPRAKSVGQVVLSGPGSSDDELTSQLGMEVGLPVEVAGPLGSLDSSALAPDDDPRRYTVAAGLSLGAAA
ncbi:MAG TPA: pilus assembly protein PilM [Thermoleophilaceae bacterium]|nr:pilus assembly protein PilM [Thermoleophilaceae bacterium]